MSHPRRLRGLVWHYLLHALNYLIPLATIPMLTRTLGPEDYGRYGVFLMWSGLAAQLIDFGVGIHATKHVASGARDTDSGDSLLARVMICQTLNALPVLVLLVGVAIALPAIESGPVALSLGALATLAIGLTPMWYYIASVRVSEIAASTIGARVACVVIIYALLPLYPSIAIAMLAYLANAAWPLAIAWRIRARIAAEIRAFRLQTYRALMHASAPYTVQRMGATLFLNLPAVLVALWFGPAAAGVFVLVDRIVRMTISLMQPLVLQLLPMQIGLQHAGANAPPARAVRQFVLITCAASFGAAIGLALLADLVVAVLAGPAYASAGNILVVLSGQVLVVTLSSIVTNRLYALNRERRVAITVWACGVGFLITAATIGRHSIEAFAGCYLAVEVACLLALLVQSRLAQVSKSAPR